MMTERRFSALVFAGCVSISFAAFGTILAAGFTADDWEFLGLVDQAPNAAVALRPLVGRFMRPLVVLAYFVPYSLFGLDPRPYHTLLVGIHAVNAFLVFLLARRIGREGERVRPVLAALVFATFAGHSEAVAWFASIADPLATLFMLSGLLVFGRALTRERAAPSTAAAWLLFVMALASKESAVIFPALVIAHGLWGERVSDSRKALRRTIAFAAPAAILVGGYLLVRMRLFGSLLGAYAGLGTSAGVFAAEARAFLLRAFLPPGELLSRWWINGYDLWLLVAGAAALAWALREVRDRRAILFALAALLIALAPALPLSISVSSTVSERFIYLATAFSSILLVWVVWRLLPRRSLAVAALVVFACVNWRSLAAANRTWAEAGDLFRSVLDSAIARVREDGPARDRPIYILTLPDSLRGAFVFRNGFYPAMRLIAPDIPAPERRIIGVTSHDTAHADDGVIVRRVGPRTFSLDLGNNVFVQTSAPDRPPYRFVDWSPSRYTLEFMDARPRGLVLYATRGAIAVSADFDSQ